MAANPTPVPAAPAATAAVDDRSYVDWPAVFAGAALAAAISFVLLTFGAAIGLSMVSPFGGEGAAIGWVALATAIWVLWAQVSSFMAGGYLAGRLRRRIGDATEHEVDVRDGAHGLIVWAAGVILGAVLAFGAIGGAMQTAGGAAAAVAEAVPDDFGYAADALFRGGTDTGEPARAEAARILFAGLTGDGVPEDDRAYLASVVAAETGLPEAEAAERVDAVIVGAEAVRNEAAEAAETARRVGVVAAFLTAASLLVSGAGAYWAASVGGRHRDEHTAFPQVFRHYK